jgi:hypothetical protein
MLFYRINSVLAEKKTYLRFRFLVRRTKNLKLLNIDYKTTHNFTAVFFPITFVRALLECRPSIRTPFILIIAKYMNSNHSTTLGEI